MDVALFPSRPPKLLAADKVGPPDKHTPYMAAVGRRLVMYSFAVQFVNI
jgi:hypothetical protein